MLKNHSFARQDNIASRWDNRGVIGDGTAKGVQRELILPPCSCPPWLPSAAGSQEP